MNCVDTTSAIKRAALAMAARGFKVFPCLPNGKPPFEYNPAENKVNCSKQDRKLAGGINIATTDPEKIAAWFDHKLDKSFGYGSLDINYGIAATGMCILDFDVKNDAWAAAEELISLGDLPKTFTTRTPSNGNHYYFGPADVGQRKLSPNIDVRSRNGYVVGPGSVIDNREYEIIVDASVAELPERIRERLAKAPERDPDAVAGVVIGDLDTESAISTAVAHLSQEPGVVDGNRGNAGFRLACDLKDYGLSVEKLHELLSEHWNVKNIPPMDNERMLSIAQNAYKSGRYPVGIRNADYELGDLPSIVAEIFPEGQKVTETKELIWPKVIQLKDKSYRTDHGHPDNCYHYLSYLGVELRYNTLARSVELGRHGRWQALDDAKADQLHTGAARHGFRPRHADFKRWLKVKALANKHNPVVRYLKSLPAWDGVERVDHWLHLYCGADDTPLTQEFGRVALIGSVQRALRPGCKYDYMLILEGPQGSEKSKVFKTLGGEWYLDGLKIGAEPKVIIEQTAGYWIVEAPELSGMEKRDVETVKAMITAQQDRARPAYGELAQTVDRAFAMFGTTNFERYLKDPTGNRRFLPVKTTTLNVKALEGDRDQLWAEALHRVRQGEMPIIASHLIAAAQEAQQARVVVSEPLLEKLSDALEGCLGKVQKADIYRLVGIRDREPTKQEYADIGTAMKTLKWTDAVRRRDHDSCRCFLKGSEDDQKHWLTLAGGRRFTRHEVGVEDQIDS